MSTCNHTCPDCAECVPTNEWNAYRRCEDCYVGPRDLFLTQLVPASEKAGKAKKKPGKFRGHKLKGGTK